MIVLNGDSGITTPTYGGTDTSEYLVPVTAFKNRIINGAMGIWQRGTTTGSVSGTTAPYMVDRFYGYAGTGNITISQSSNVPSGYTYSCSMVGTGVSITQRIESKNCTDLGGATVTVSFWALNSSGSDNLSVSLYTATGGVDNWSSQTSTANVVSASPSGSWTYYTSTFTSIPSTATNGVGIGIGRGSSGSSTTLITGVQLEKGSTATSFDYRPYSTEFDLCRRYCEVYTQGEFPQQFAPIDVNNRPETMIMYYQKRAAPTITVATPTNFNWQTAANTYPAITSYGGTYVGTGLWGATMFFNTASGVTTNTLSAVGAIGFTGANSITISAEL